MAQSFISFFIDDAATTALGTRVPNAVFNSGMFGGASNSPGIGISTENPDLTESEPNWTLLDQWENARAGQIGQLIGGNGITLSTDWPGSGGTSFTAPDATIRLMDPAQLPTAAQKEAVPSVDGNLTFPAPNAQLVDMDVGWEVTP